jgi:hypothetical protein
LHSLGVRSDGRIAAWGDNQFGQCNVPEPNAGFVKVAAGHYHSMGLRTDGSIVAWGQNGHGVCDAPSPNTGFTAIAAGAAHNLGLRANVVTEGEGVIEGEGEGGAPAPHSADVDGDGVINLSELLRVIQFYNLGGYQCVTPPGTSEDGYLAGPGENHACVPHASDYHPQDWQLNLSEILRLIQFFNVGAYHACPGLDTEDGYCPGLA